MSIAAVGCCLLLCLDFMSVLLGAESIGLLLVKLTATHSGLHVL